MDKHSTHGLHKVSDILDIMFPALFTSKKD